MNAFWHQSESGRKKNISETIERIVRFFNESNT